MDKLNNINHLGEFDRLIKIVVSKLYHFACNDYDSLSSFAIVTDEGYECFGVAINTDIYFNDLVEFRTSDEDYWNTAEWYEEMLESHYKIAELDEVWKFLATLNEEDKNKHFLVSCLNALQSIRTKDNLNICLQVHITDHGFDKKLFEIVEILNPKEVADSYKEYYLGWN